jgi:signal transduction histidine kinase
MTVPATDSDQSRIAELEAALEMRDQFIATIGHEMRNPMVPIVLAVERIKRLALAEDWTKLRSSLDLLDHATAAFMRRATQLLDISRFSSSNLALPTTPLDLSALVHDTAKRHSEIARRAGCPLNLNIPPGIAIISDQPAVEQLLDNILSNAFKYGAGRPVDITVHAEPTQAAITIADHGIGIPPDAEGKIFNLFERARRADAPGLGIGLWISARLAAAVGGSITVASVTGQGAAFTIRLPLFARSPSQEI